MKKVSALIIAHNEEQYIGRCIESILEQKDPVDEIVLIAHNSTDRTIEIANRYPIKVVSFQGKPGIVYARIEGLKHVEGEIILCIDGDSYAANNWSEVMVSALERKNVLVGSSVVFRGTLYGRLANMLLRYGFSGKDARATNWIWGPSFGFWRKDALTVQTIWERSIELSKELKLTRNPEDYWLALLMSNEGHIEVTNKTFVVNAIKETTSIEAARRNFENMKNGGTMLAFFKKELQTK